MDKSKFFFKWILPFITSFFLFGCIGCIIDSMYDLDDLMKAYGKIKRYEFYDTYSRRSTSGNMRLFLDNGEIYNINSEWENKFLDIEDALKKSTVAEIYHRSPSQTIWRLGKINEIYQLKIGTSMIYSIQCRQEKSKQTSYISGFIGIVGLITIIIRRRIKKASPVQKTA